MATLALVALGMVVITSACAAGGGTTRTSYTVTASGATSNGTPPATATFTLVVD